MTNQVAVSIERRTLFVGSTAYPLQGIVGVQAMKWVVNRDWAKREFIKGLLITLAVGLCVVGGLSQASSAAAAVGVLAVIGVIVLLARTLNNRLNRPPVYALTVQNAAGAQNLVFSEDGAQVNRIVSGIIDAIDDSSTKLGPIYIDQSNNIHAGRDYVSATGSGNTITTGR
jgi:hypothetical protein